jgi:hypothetical protein
MGDHGNLQGMLRIVLRLGVAHETPAADKLQAGKISKKSVSHGDSFQTSIIPGGRGSFKTKKTPGHKPGSARKLGSELPDFLEAGGADHPVLIGHKTSVAPAEHAIRLILTEDNGIAFHKDFQHILRTDFQGTPELDGENDAAKGIKLTDYACRLHRKNLRITASGRQLK